MRRRVRFFTLLVSTLCLPRAFCAFLVASSLSSRTSTPRWCSLATRRIASRSHLAMSGLDRGVSRKEQLGKPYTSIDAASDADVLGTQTIDPYVGTALGTVREAYCAENSDIPESVEAALEFVERETNTKLCKQYMLTGKLAAACLSMLVRMAGARNVLEIGAYTGYSTIALASTGAAVTTIDSFEDEAESEAIFHAGVQKSGLPITLLKMKAIAALEKLIAAPPERPFDFVFIDADKTEQIQYYELLMSNPDVFAPLSPGRTCTIVVDNTLWYSRVLRKVGDPDDACTAAVKQFTAHVKRDPRSCLTMLPVRDGMSIVQKTST